MVLSCLFKSIGNNRNSATVDDFFDKDINTDVYFAIIYEKMCYIASKTIDVYCLGSNVSFLFCQTCCNYVTNCYRVNRARCEFSRENHCDFRFLTC